ncbi:MAG: VWA domain-containing protein [Chitinispirillales bacterium]|jgi:hypothetical protein|nr:VWA domain-containing protein [Chitinispirillales bacterium]
MKNIMIISVIMVFAVCTFPLEIRLNSKYKEWSDSDTSFGFLATVYTDDQRSQQAEPLQVLYMIDVSKNFTGNVRQEFINGGMKLVQQLSDNDYFGIILYGEYSRTLLPLSQIGFVGREKIYSLLSELSTEKGRDPLSALEKAVSEFSQNEGRRCDGKSLVMTVLGETDEDGEGNSYDKKMISAMNNLGVQVYTIGHGDDFNEDAAISTAEKTGGRAYFTGKDRADLLGGKFNLIFAHIINPINTRNVEIEFATRDGIKITNFKDSVLSKIFIPKLVIGDTVNFFLEMKNRPKKGGDIDVDFDYENVAIRSNSSGTASIKVNLTRGSSNYAENADKYIKYQVLFNMAKSIDELKIGNKNFRKDYADGFRKMLETRLGPIRNEINNREIQQVFVDMVNLYNMITGGTASNGYLAKYVKYALHNCLFSE